MYMYIYMLTNCKFDQIFFCNRSTIANPTLTKHKG